MPATGFILPASVDLTALIGADFSTTINLYQDVAQTTAFDLTGYTVSLIIGVPTVLFTLTTGAGLTIATPSNGTIVAALTAAQTSTVNVASADSKNSYRYQLKLVDGSGVVSFPLSGHMIFLDP